ncbi:hypothetical protein BG261_01995 [Floricoccus tropicus]|uniref:TPM domain-containing protein n=1 Tax=Floricoccus tropicus TaxID=1859473 RepID=A0A1E8GPG0_9LACT|nr:TPM domain-containing protein [Floricoccus tropicus]OFI49378.1 hypothetical protein BG261_01995 [Floricoccus tropicus]
MKKFISFIVILMTIMFTNIVVFADSKYVVDDAKILSQSTISNIDSLNSEMVNMSHHPVYVVYTLNDLQGRSLKEIATKKFDELGLGYKGYNNGILFAISPNAREYYFAMGADYNPSTKKLIATNIVGKDSNIISELKSENYDSAVNNITNNVRDFSMNYSKNIDQEVSNESSDIVEKKYLVWGSFSFIIISIIMVAFNKIRKYHKNYQKRIDALVEKLSDKGLTENITDIINDELVHLTPEEYIRYWENLSPFDDEERGIDLLVERTKTIEELYNETYSINQLKELSSRANYTFNESYEVRLKRINENIANIGLNDEIEAKYIRENNEIINNKMEESLSRNKKYNKFSDEKKNLVKTILMSIIVNDFSNIITKENINDNIINSNMERYTKQAIKKAHTLKSEGADIIMSDYNDHNIYDTDSLYRYNSINSLIYTYSPHESDSFFDSSGGGFDSSGYSDGSSGGTW